MRRIHIRNLVLAALISTIAWMSVFVFRVNVQFLTYDIKDAIITIGGLICGSFWVIPMAIVASLLEMITLSSTGWYGFLMNAASTIAFAFVACAVYNHFKSFTSALVGLFFGVISMTGIMLLMNLFVTPLYFADANVKDVIDMIPTLLLPFNLTKSVMNAAIILLLYKPFIKALRKAKVIGSARVTSVQSGETIKSGIQLQKIKNESAASLIIGFLLFAIAAVVFFWFFRAKISFF